MLVLEDVETIVTHDTRSYFFNEMDGLENNDGLFVVASTNFLDKLDPGLTKRPSRFDRKYEFPLPNEHERTLYCEFWRKKLKSNESIDFPRKLCPHMAHVTPGFSFAFLQECFVATLLVLARENDEDNTARPYDGDNDDLDDYRLWVVFKKEAKILRKEIDRQAQQTSQLAAWCRRDAPQEAGPSTSHTSPSAAHHCGGCQCRNDEQQSAPLPFRKLEKNSDILPVLPVVYQKHPYINTAAYMYQ
jgi:transitional endoplasmic reticulum ATPase